MEKLINIAMLGNMLTRSFALQRALPGVAAIALFTIVAAVLGGVLLTGGFYGLYIILSFYTDPNTAAMIVTALIFATAILLISLAFLQLQKLRALSSTLSRQKMPALAQAEKVLDAFLAGVLTPRPKVHLKNH